MWPFGEQRRRKRYRVDWSGNLHCVFPEFSETLSVTVDEVSLGGARLCLERLQVGPYHLVIGERDARLDLSIPVNGGEVHTGIDIRWYDWNAERRHFAVGVTFCGMSPESESALRQALKDLPR